MRFRLVIAFVAMMYGLPVLAAQDGAKVAAKYNCLACHSVNAKIVGPAYKDVAARYSGQKDAEQMLMKEVRAGVKGKWGGPVAMPPQVIGDADLKIIVRWVLSLDQK